MNNIVKFMSHSLLVMATCLLSLCSIASVAANEVPFSITREAESITGLQPMDRKDASGGKVARIGNTIGLWGWASIPLDKELPAGKYRVTIRIWGVPEPTSHTLMYWVKGTAHLPESGIDIPAYTDSTFHEDTIEFLADAPFREVILKHGPEKDVPGVQIDWLKIESVPMTVSTKPVQPAENTKPMIQPILLQTGNRQIIENTALDSHEAPRIERLITSVDGKNLVLRFMGQLKLGRELGANATSPNKFHHADNRLIVTLNNDVLDSYTITVGPNSTGDAITAQPATSHVQVNDDCVEVTVPLQLIKYTPVEVMAEINRLYFGNATMVSGEGRNLFATVAGPAQLKIKDLPENPNLPVISNLKISDVWTNSVSLQWETNTRTTSTLRIESAGQVVRTETLSFCTRQHRITLLGLQPGKNYAIHITGSDMGGHTTKVALLSVTTKPTNGKTETSSAWLSVRGKNIVDAAGRPFSLGGYSHYVGEYWWNEFPRYGTPALTARYFRSMGLNVCRLGLVESASDGWSASIMKDGSAFDRYGGAAGYVKKFLRPIADQIMNEGMYVIIDWHDSYKLDDKKVRQIGEFWDAVAEEFKDEPRVAMYQLLNEPCFTDGQNRADLAERIRQITKDYITRIRKYDKRHIILVSDWNCGWGWATESQWQAVNFQPGDVMNQVVYSKHIAGEHMTNAFMGGGVDNVVDRWDVPVIFDEVENGQLVGPAETLWFYKFLLNNPHEYGFATWVCGQYWPEFPSVTAAFAQAYLPRPPFGPTGEPAITDMWNLSMPTVNQANNKWYYRFAVPTQLAAGDYGMVVQGVPIKTSLAVAVAAHKGDAQFCGVWLGSPHQAKWQQYTVAAGASAVEGATYWHAPQPFEEIIIRSDTELKDVNALSLFQLNPKHEMPVPSITMTAVQ